MIFVNAQPIDISLFQTSYAKGESVQAWINVTGDLRNQIKYSDIGLLKNNQEIPIYPYLTKLEDSLYFAYYNLPINLEEGEYSFIVKNLMFVENQVLVKKNKIQNFSLTNTTGISLLPGVFKVEDLNRDYVFQLFVKNNKQNDVNVYFGKTKPYTFLMKDTFSLKPGEEKILEIYFDHNLVNKIENDIISVSDGEKNYQIPIWLGFENGTIINNTPILVDNVTEILVEFTNENDNTWVMQLEYGKTAGGSLFFKNYANKSISNITFIFTGNLDEIATLDDYNIDYLEPYGASKNALRINEDGKATPGVYNGTVRLIYDGKYADFYVDVLVKEEITILEKNDTINKTYVENTTYNPGGFVTGDADEEEKDGSNTWIWIFLVVLVILITVLFIYFMEKNKKKPTFFGS